MGDGRWAKGEGQSDWSDRACGSASREGWGASRARARGSDFFWKDLVRNTYVGIVSARAA